MPEIGGLSDIRVIDLAGEPGLFAGRLLGEFGADVIRIEPPGGDPVRRIGPFLDRGDGPPLSLYHLHFNANKRGITLDFTKAEGRRLLGQLASVSDGLIETAAPGYMDNLGAGFDALRSENPRLIYVTITPFGQAGPGKSYRGNDLVGVASSGLMWLNGMPDDPPIMPGGEQAYHMASFAAASGFMLAMAGRDRNGDRNGHRIDISIQEAATMATLQTANPNAYTWYGRVPGRRGLSGLAGGRSLFKCVDGLWISFIVPPYRWTDFLKWLNDEGIESELANNEWADPAYRVQHGDIVASTIQRLAARYPRSDLFHEGQRRRLLVMPVNTPRELLLDEQLNSRAFFVDVAPPGLGRALYDSGPAARSQPTSIALRRPAPDLGEHNGDVFCELLGLPEVELARLKGRGVI